MICQLATCDDRRPCIGLCLSPYTMDGEPLARSTIFWARHRLKQSTAIDSSIKGFSVRFSQFIELSETLKCIMYPEETFDKLNLPQFDVGN
ncbi:hypothetical protein TNCV_197651 [Trichonephila clavipes]|nr:hypothetical protein TNCV_197651 [Trichonephila clavipes]